MSNRHEVEGRQIHPRALAELGEEECIVALGVARDLRSGVIPPDKFDMFQTCGAACCIAGHVAFRLGTGAHMFYLMKASKHGALSRLFSSHHPSDPILAAEAIERFVYDGSEDPWQPA